MTIIMNIHRRRTAEQFSEITDLDVRIEKKSDKSSNLELLSHKLKQEKDHIRSLENLIRENDYLRQELVFYKKSRNVMLIFHDQVLEFYNILKVALKKLSKKMSSSETDIIKY